MYSNELKPYTSGSRSPYRTNDFYKVVKMSPYFMARADRLNRSLYQLKKQQEVLDSSFKNAEGFDHNQFKSVDRFVSRIIGRIKTVNTEPHLYFATNSSERLSTNSTSRGKRVKMKSPQIKIKEERPTSSNRDDLSIGMHTLGNFLRPTFGTRVKSARIGKPQDTKTMESSRPNTSTLTKRTSAQSLRVLKKQHDMQDIQTLLEQTMAITQGPYFTKLSPRPQVTLICSGSKIQQLNQDLKTDFQSKYIRFVTQTSQEI